MPKFVIAIMKVLPDDVDTDLVKLLQAIKKKMPAGCEVVKDETVPIAFGLSALKFQVKIPYGMEGGTQPVEDALSGITGVQRVETEVVSNL
ncbi:MAG: elongation factor 1-beta [Promethearchaeota archaeon CR_4]|nr:MAG: elongation factor 1-beta [Candidatus Lokiarchaeota archaeon CR_4]